MEIFYCDVCGHRIPDSHFGAGTALRIENKSYCSKCPRPTPAAPPAPVEMQVAAVANVGTGSTAASLTPASSRETSTMPSAKRTTLIKSRSTGIGTGTGVRHHTPGSGTELGEEDQPIHHKSEKKPLSSKAIVFGSVGVLVLSLVVILVFSGGTTKKSDETHATTSPAASSPDSTKLSPSASTPSTLSKLSDQKAFSEIHEKFKTLKNDDYAKKIELLNGFLEQYEKSNLADQALRELRDLRELAFNTEQATPANTTPRTPTPPTAPPIPTPKVESLTTMTDPDALRAKLLAMPVGERSIDAIRHLGELPVPAMELKTVAISMKEVQADGGSTVTAGTFEGEEGAKVEGGGYIACYVAQDTVINHTQIKIRIYQKGITKFLFKNATIFEGERFIKEFAPPPEGVWTDMTVDISKAVGGNIKFENQPLKHIEMRGYPTAGDKGAYYILSKFEIVNGGILGTLGTSTNASNDLLEMQAATAFETLKNLHTAKTVTNEFKTALDFWQKTYDKTKCAADNATEIKAITAFVLNEKSTTPNTNPVANAKVDLKNKLVGHWKLNESAGSKSAADDSGENHAGTVKLGVLWSTGILGGSASFDGGTGFIDIPGVSASAEFTVSCWIKHNAGVTAGKKERYLTLDDECAVLSRDEKGFLSFKIKTAKEVSISSKVRLKPQVWVLVTGTWDGTTQKLYRNGILESEQTPGGSIKPSISNLKLGGAIIHGLNGLLDDVRVYHRALSIEEVLALYELGVPAVKKDK